jgi:hypothetical protein
VDTIDARGLALPSQQDEQPSIAEPSFVRQITQSSTQFCVRRPTGTVANHFAVRSDDMAGPPFRQAHHGLKVRNAVAPGGGPSHFFDKSSRSAAASSICSARSFFSFAFSS